MITKKWYVFILLLVVIGNDIYAQTSPDEVREANKNNKIAFSDILGRWCPLDSSEAEINFVQSGQSVFIEGITHGVGEYFFSCKSDSLFVNGVAPNWPPYDCTLFLLSKNELEIKFYQFFQKETHGVVYRKKIE